MKIQTIQVGARLPAFGSALVAGLLLAGCASLEEITLDERSATAQADIALALAPQEPVGGPVSLYTAMDEIVNKPATFTNINVNSPRKLDTEMADGAMGVFSSPRVWWNFKAMGVNDVAVLDGGLPKWLAENRPVDDHPVKRPERHFSARLDHSAVSDLQDILRLTKQSNTQIVDARSAGRFAGTDPEPRQGMGSFTALMTAIERPNAILSLTLIGCSTGPQGVEGIQAYRDALRREIALLDDKAGDGAVDWFANDSAYIRMIEKQPEIWRTYLDRLKSQSVAGARAVLNSVHWNRQALTELRESIQKIPAPVLVLYGEEDHPLVLQTAPILQECFPNVRVRAVTGTGHLVHLEEPELFLDAFGQLTKAARDGRNLKGAQ